jgi:GTPase involved in cell partitioning and DNA repair
MVGGANAGKSSLLARLTNAEPEVGATRIQRACPNPG